MNPPKIPPPLEIYKPYAYATPPYFRYFRIDGETDTLIVKLYNNKFSYYLWDCEDKELEDLLQVSRTLALRYAPNLPTETEMEAHAPYTP